MKKIAETKDFKRLSKTTGIPIEELSNKIITHIEEKQGWAFGKVDLDLPEPIDYLIDQGDGWNSAVMLQEIIGYYSDYAHSLFLKLYVIWDDEEKEDDGYEGVDADFEFESKYRS